ncbi:hypothetical protein Tco_0784748, partial [Tanacetum coccineum]
MANAEHAPAMASPVRTDEQIVPHNRWVPIGKRNCYLNEEKSQPSPIFKIAVDILKQTNFFRAFTASSTIPAIYIQQFWDTICFDSKAGSYKCQLDEQWFNLTQDTLRDALQITPIDNNRAFSSPPTPDTLVEFVNKLGYPKEVIHLSNVTTKLGFLLLNPALKTQRRQYCKRETDTGKFQPLPEVPGKGKEKVGEEQVAQVLLNLQTPKKKSSAEQYIFQRRSHIPTVTAGHEDSSSLYAKLG